MTHLVLNLEPGGSGVPVPAPWKRAVAYAYLFAFLLAMMLVTGGFTLLPANSTSAQSAQSARAQRAVQEVQEVPLDDAFHLLSPCNISVTQGQVFTLDLLVNAGSHLVTAQQAYLTFTPGLLEVIPNGGTCGQSATTVQIDGTTFEASLQNVVNNSTGEIAFASGTFGNPGTGQFRVARLHFCAEGSGTATINWQFIAPRSTGITDDQIPPNRVENQALYQNCTVTITGGATATAVPPTQTRTATAVPPTATQAGTSTTIPPTSTGQPPTSTLMPPTSTREPCTLTFTDVPTTNTFYHNIRCLACRGIVSGYADGTFRPNNEVTRGQLAKIVSNAAGFTESPNPQIFEDVSPANTFYQWINRLARRGHMSGYACGGVGEPCISGMPYFRPFANATRGQTSKIVSNAAGYTEIPTDQTFEDVPPTHTFYREIQRLATRNIMQGYLCGGVGEPCVSGRPYFRPANNVTRGQSAKIVANTFYPGCETP